MHGLIHLILKDLVHVVADAETWSKILIEAGVDSEKDEENALGMIAHKDDLTLKLVGATCAVTGLTLQDALRAFGHHFVKYALRSGHGPFLRSQGTDLPAFLANINNLHSHLERDFPKARFPFIESTYDPEQQFIELLYSSARQGMQPVLVGILEEIGVRMFGVDVTLEELPLPEDLQEAGVNGNSAAWRVTWRPHQGEVEPLNATQVEEDLPKTSFFSLHSSLVEVMKKIRSSVGCCASESQGKPVAAEGVDIEEPSLVYKRSEVQSMDGRPLDDVLMRATPARQVAAGWKDESLEKCREFWQDSNGTAQQYLMSEDAQKADVFVSHAWNPPEDWNSIMGEDISYADIKSTMLSVVAKDLVTTTASFSSWKDVTLWVDKACIPQEDDALKQLCVALIGKFIAKAEYVCVLFTWSYLDRLWCVFEWACMLADKQPNQIWLQNDMFVTDQSFPLYLASVRQFDLDRTKCRFDSDRKILFEQIDRSYVSRAAFQRLVQATAIALMARSMVYRAGRSKRLRKRFFQPWVDLAQELGFEELALALDTCSPEEWRGAEVGEDSMPVSKMDSAMSNGFSVDKLLGSIGGWFNEMVNPVLGGIRKEAIKS